MSRRNNRVATESSRNQRESSRNQRESSRNQRNQRNHGETTVEDIITTIELQLNIYQSENANVRGPRIATRTARWSTRYCPTHSSINTTAHSARECDPTWDARRGEQRHPSWGPGQPTSWSNQPRTRQWRNERSRYTSTTRASRGQRENARHASGTQNQVQRR